MSLSFLEVRSSRSDQGGVGQFCRTSFSEEHRNSGCHTPARCPQPTCHPPTQLPGQPWSGLRFLAGPATLKLAAVPVWGLSCTHPLQRCPCPASEPWPARLHHGGNEVGKGCYQRRPLQGSGQHTPCPSHHGDDWTVLLFQGIFHPIQYCSLTDIEIHEFRSASQFMRKKKR